jgi:UDP-glucose:(heptosyl)LPS alpha-1,3-glucosyltransferase
LEKVIWHRVPGPGWPEVADFASYHYLAGRMLRARRFDIVHSVGCNVPRADVIAIQNIQPAKRKVLKQFESRERVSVARRMTRELYLRVTSRAERRVYSFWKGCMMPMFLPVSKGTEAELRSWYEIGQAGVRVVPNAADTRVFQPIPEVLRRQWRAENGVREDAVLLMFAGGEWARKGLELAISAVGKLAEGDVQLYVAGEDADRERYRELARRHHVESDVIFGGFRSDIATALAAADIFVFPSWYEAFSLATIEAAACGLPVVATRVNGVEELVQPGITGELVEHDGEAIARVLAPLVANKSLRRTMGLQARRRVEECYTWDRVAAMTEDAYLSHLESARCRSKLVPTAPQLTGA